MSPSKTSTIAFSVVVAAASVAILTATPAQSQLGVKNTVALQGATPGVSQSGHVNVSGTVKAGNFSGSGAGLSSLNASNITSGTIGGAFLPAAVAMEDEANLFIQPNTFSALATFTAGARFGGFTGVNRPSGPINSYETFGIGDNSADWDGMYVKTGATGKPFYGYSAGSQSAYHYLHPNTGTWQLTIGSNTPLEVGPNGIGIGVPPSTNLGINTNKQIHMERPESSAIGFSGSFTGNFSKGAEIYAYGESSYGLIGRAVPENSVGVYADNVGFAGGVGIYASGWGSTSTGVSANGGSYGVDASTTNGWGVRGTSNTSHGVVGMSDSAEAVVGVSVAANKAGSHGYNATVNGHGGWFYAAATTGTGVGVIGQTASANGYGVQSFGRFMATGTKAFRIDHPLEPETKFLQHYCTEGPEPLNVYSGMIDTDNNGYAQVVLPDYFEAINRDARVQLTVDDDSEDFVMAKVVGGVKGNGFRIRTSKPGVKVYWEVKGVRNDKFIQEYGAPVEIQKTGREIGKYQHPELYGAPRSMSIAPQIDTSKFRVEAPDLSKRLPRPTRTQGSSTASRAGK